MPAEASWHYRLNGLVEVAIRQGIVPVVRCLADLLHAPGVMFSPSLFLYQDTSSHPWKEVDIALITDGLLVVAEVKQGKIGERDIEGFCELGKAIRPNRLIFFASKKPSKRISKKLEAAAQELKALAVELKFGIVEDI